jgi:hypothetical protein
MWIKYFPKALYTDTHFIAKKASENNPLLDMVFPRHLKTADIQSHLRKENSSFHMVTVI